jgi:hypothetical protein
MPPKSAPKAAKKPQPAKAARPFNGAIKGRGILASAAKKAG